MDPLDDHDDSRLREHFAALRTDTLARLRPAGALAARRSRAATQRRRALIGAVASVLVVLGSVGGYLLVGRPGSERGTPLAVTTPVASTAGGAAHQGTGPARPGGGPGPVRSAAATPGPPGGPVPPGFQAESITFISTNSAWALGYAPCLVGHPWSQCPAVVRSRDGGHTWVGVPAPGEAAYLGDIRFVNLLDGWIVVRAPLLAGDPGGVSGVLYATHDGGATWHQIGSVPDPVAVEAAAGRVWVSSGPVAGSVSGSAASGPPGSASAPPPGPAPDFAPAYAVYSAAIGGDAFTRVAGSSGPGLVVHGHYAYGYGGTDLLSIKDGTVTRRSLPCLDGYRDDPVLAASGDLSLAVVCAGPPAGSGQPKQAFTSNDGGVTWTAAGGAVDSTGSVRSLAATGSAVFLAGRGMPVRVTRDAGASWQAALRAPGPDGFGYIGFTDDDRGVALAAGRSTVVYLTGDAGRTWTTHQFG